MKNFFRFSFIITIMIVFSSFALHKFYVSIYQINYAKEKKMLQITSRIFIDDMNVILEKEYHKKTFIGEKNQSPGDIVLMKKYISENFSIKVNGQQKTINFLSEELEGNVIICYYNITAISKIKTIEVKNTVLIDLNSEQQNIIQTTVSGDKQSLLLTDETIKGILKY